MLHRTMAGGNVPWTMLDAVARQAGVTIGKDYPTPVVDHAARVLAMDKWQGMRGKCD